MSARVEAFSRLQARIEETAKRVEGVPEREIDHAIDEAVEYVRHNPEGGSLAAMRASEATASLSILFSRRLTPMNAD